jgi:hypothetical protein
MVPGFKSLLQYLDSSEYHMHMQLRLSANVVSVSSLVNARSYDIIVWSSDVNDCLKQCSPCCRAGHKNPAVVNRSSSCGRCFIVTVVLYREGRVLAVRCKRLLKLTGCPSRHPLGLAVKTCCGQQQRVTIHTCYILPMGCSSCVYGQKVFTLQGLVLLSKTRQSGTAPCASSMLILVAESACIFVRCCLSTHVQ